MSLYTHGGLSLFIVFPYKHEAVPLEQNFSVLLAGISHYKVFALGRRNLPLKLEGFSHLLALTSFLTAGLGCVAGISHYGFSVYIVIRKDIDTIYH